MRSELWPDSKDDHMVELEQYFLGSSIDIVQAYVIEDENEIAVGFIELNLRKQSIAESAVCGGLVCQE